MAVVDGIVHLIIAWSVGINTFLFFQNELKIIQYILYFMKCVKVLKTQWRWGTFQAYLTKKYSFILIIKICETAGSKFEKRTPGLFVRQHFCPHFCLSQSKSKSLSKSKEKKMLQRIDFFFWLAVSVFTRNATKRNCHKMTVGREENSMAVDYTFYVIEKCMALIIIITTEYRSL